MLGAAALVAFSSSTVLAQMPGLWTGTTSHGGQMSFRVNDDNTVSYYSSAAVWTCESGATVGGGFSLSFFPGVPIVDGNFEGGFPPRDGFSFSALFSGAFSSDTEAAGSHTSDTTAFRILDDGFTAQICEDAADWMATWQGPVPPQPTTGLPFAPGDAVTTYSDGKLSFQIVKKAAAPK
jgi:hypothetical protein